MTSTSKIWKELTSILSSLNNFHSLEVVDRVSETELQVGENSNWIIWRLKDLVLLSLDPGPNVLKLGLFFSFKNVGNTKCGSGKARWQTLWEIIGGCGQCWPRGVIVPVSPSKTNEWLMSHLNLLRYQHKTLVQCWGNVVDVNPAL